VPLESITAFARLLVDEAHTSSDFGCALFYIGFVGPFIMFCKYDPGNLRFCFVPAIDNFKDCLKTLQDHSDYLFQAVDHAKSFLKTAGDRRGALKSLFKFLSDEKVAGDIQDIIYIHSGEIGAQIDFGPPPRLHLIQFAGEPSFLNVQLALQTNSTYSVQSQIGGDTLTYFKTCLGGSAVNSRLRIFTSAGALIQKAYGPIKNMTIERGSSATIDLKFFLRAVPPYLILRPTKDPADAVSIQIVIDVFDAQLFVMNHVWKRAASPAEWGSSLDFVWCSAQFIQIRAAEELRSLGISVPWQVPERRIKFSREVNAQKRKVESFEKFIRLIMSSNDMFTPQQKAYLLLATYYGRDQFFDDLYRALTTPGTPGQALIVPPYIACEAPDPPQVDLSQFSCGMVPIRLHPKRFARLKSVIHDVKAELGVEL
jgi:hypothetical protein